MFLRNPISIIFLFLSFGGTVLFAQTDLETGKTAFAANQRKEAKQSLLKATSQPAQKAEAHLLLSLLSSLEENEVEAFRHFNSFFNASDNPYPYTFAFWSTGSVHGSNSELGPERLLFMENLTRDPKANGTLKAMAWGALGRHFAAINQFPKSREAYGKIGQVTTWSLVGEFENISESGFDKVFEPVSKPQSDASFVNKNGAKVTWFPMKGNRDDGWLDFDFHFFTNEAILYAQTFVQSPREQDVVFRIGTSGSLKCWLNDALVVSESEERNNDLDTYQAKVRLSQGYNRILVQIGSSEINNSNFMLRITDDLANPISGLQFSPSYQPYTKAKMEMPPRVSVFAEAFFEDQVANGKAGLVEYMALANAYLRNDKGYEARKALLNAVKLAPNCSYVKIQQMEAFNRSQNETDAKITLEWLKVNDPECLLSLNLNFNEEIEKEAYPEARKILQKIESLYGQNEATLLKQIVLAGKEKNQDQVLRLVEEAYKKYPENLTYVDLKVDIEKSVNQSLSGAINVWKKYLSKHYSFDAQKSLSDLYFSKGNESEGIKAYQKIIDNSPFSPGYRFNLGKYFFGTRKYDLSEKYFLECLELAPYISYYWAGLAQNYKEKGNNAKAIESYQKALELQPGDFDSREELRKLFNKPDVFSYFKKSDVYEIVRKSPAPSTYPEDNSLVLLDEVQKVVYAGGTSDEKRTFVVKVMNTEGINRWKEYYIQHYQMQSFNVEKAEVVKANGSRVEGSSNGEEVVFTNLEVGDAIHVVYKVKSANSGKLAPHFWESFYFSHFLPYLTTRYSLLVENGVKFRHKFSKEEIPAQVEAKDEFTLHTWEKQNQPGLTFEDKMPELSDVGNNLFFSTIPDWTFVSNWYHDLAASKSKVNLEVKEAVGNVLAGKSNITDLEKARLIYEHIVGNIKYLSVSFLQSGLIPQKASHTLNTRLGDCKDVSTLFVAMCREAGLKAELVLVSSRNNGKHQMLLPSIDFNHCIARLTASGKDYYIELTSDKLPFNTFYDNLKNASCLQIKSEQSGEKCDLIHLNPPTRNRNIILRETELRLEGNDVRVKKTNFKTGVFASHIRDLYRDLGQNDQFKEMQRAISGDYNQTQLKSLRFQGLQGIGDSVRYEYEFFGPEALSEVGGMNLLPFPWSERSKAFDFNFTDDRKYPIDLWNIESDGEEERILFFLPPGKELAELPKDVELTSPVARYSMKFVLQAGCLKATRRFEYLKDEIPLSEMKAFEVFYRKMVAADSRQLAVRPKSPTKLSSKKG